MEAAEEQRSPTGRTSAAATWPATSTDWSRRARRPAVCLASPARRPVRAARRAALAGSVPAATPGKHGGRGAEQQHARIDTQAREPGVGHEVGQQRRGPGGYGEAGHGAQPRQQQALSDSQAHDLPGARAQGAPGPPTRAHGTVRAPPARPRGWMRRWRQEQSGRRLQQRQREAEIAGARLLESHRARHVAPGSSPSAPRWSASMRRATAVTSAPGRSRAITLRTCTLRWLTHPSDRKTPSGTVERRFLQQVEATGQHPHQRRRMAAER